MPRDSRPFTGSCLSVVSAVVVGLTIVGSAARPVLASPAGKAPKKGWSSTESALKKAIVSRQFSTAIALVSELAQTDDPRGFEIIIENALGGHDYELDRHAGKMVATARDPRIREVVFKKITGGAGYKAKIILLAVVKRWPDDPKALAALHGALGSRRKEVVFAALRWVRELRRPDDSLPALVDALAKWERKAQGRVYFDLKRTLEELTGHDLPMSADWKNYLKMRKTGKKPKKRRTKGKTVVYKPPTFFSVAVNSDRVLFVIDVSTSMNMRDTIVEEPVRKKSQEGPRGRTKVVPGNSGKTAAPRTIRRQVTRLERVKLQLIDTVNTLPPHVRFNIVSFSHELGHFEAPNSLVNATAATRERAIAWIRNLKANGVTRTDKVIEHSFLSSEIDTIMLLTDGAPKDEQNRLIPPESVLDLARVNNRFRKTRINTIGFAQAGGRMKKFVLDLAKQNDGECVLLE